MRATIIDGVGKKADIEGRLAQIKAQIEETTSRRELPVESWLIDTALFESLAPGGPQLPGLAPRAQSSP